MLDANKWIHVNFTIQPGVPSGGGSTIKATPQLKFRPLSWKNFTNQFLPCYGGLLIKNFLGNDDNAGVTAASIALAVLKPKIGGPLLLLWAGVNAVDAGAKCAYTSRAVYE